MKKFSRYLRRQYATFPTDVARGMFNQQVGGNYISKVGYRVYYVQTLINTGSAWKHRKTILRRLYK